MIAFFQTFVFFPIFEGSVRKKIIKGIEMSPSTAFLLKTNIYHVSPSRTYVTFLLVLYSHVFSQYQQSNDYLALCGYTEAQYLSLSGILEGISTTYNNLI